MANAIELTNDMTGNNKATVAAINTLAKVINDAKGTGTAPALVAQLEEVHAALVAASKPDWTEPEAGAAAVPAPDTRWTAGAKADAQTKEDAKARAEAQAKADAAKPTSGPAPFTPKKPQ